MSKYAVYTDGKWREIVVRRPAFSQGTDNKIYTVWVGDEEWGTVQKGRLGSWTALSYWFASMDLITGFATRRDAVEYVIKHYMSRGANLNSILSIGYNETGTHFRIYNLDDRPVFDVHVREIGNVNLHELLDQQALEAIRRDFYPEYQDDARPAGES